MFRNPPTWLCVPLFRRNHFFAKRTTPHTQTVSHFLSFSLPAQFWQHGAPKHVVVCPYAVNGQHCQPGICLGCRSDGVSHAIGSCSGGQRKLERSACLFNVLAELVNTIPPIQKNGYGILLWEQVCDKLQHSHKQQSERREQQAAHQARHQWRRWHIAPALQRTRGVHALSLHAHLSTVCSWWYMHTSWLKSRARSHFIHGHTHGALSREACQSVSCRRL